MKKLMIYPIEGKITFLVRNRDILENYILTAVVSEKGINMDNLDVSALDRYSDTRFYISEDFEEELKKCDTVLFIDEKEINIWTYKAKIEATLASGKEIIITEGLQKMLSDTYISIEEKIKVLSMNEEIPLHEPAVLKHMVTRGLNDIDVPVILVYGLGENCRKFDTQLAIRRFFINKGNQILQYGTNSLSRLFGFQTLPAFLFEKGYTMEEKTLLLNQYLYDKIRSSQWDVLIIGVPGGILPFNHIITNHFGELAFIISNAVSADISILNLYYQEDLNVEFLLTLQESSKHRLNTEINYFAMSNICNMYRTEGEPNMHYFSVDNNKVINKVNKTFADQKLSIFSLNDKGQEQAFEKIYYELSENIQVL